jgi:integration host factor subunit alpha
MPKTLTKADIVEKVWGKTHWRWGGGKTKEQTKAQVESLLAIVKQAIKRDGSLLISGFGKFEAYGKQARRGRNPHTGARIVLPPRRVVVFRLSGKFRALLNGRRARP